MVDCLLGGIRLLRRQVSWSYEVRLHCGAKSGYVWRMNSILYLKQHLLLWKLANRRLSHSFIPSCQYANTCNTAREYCQCWEKLFHSTASLDVWSYRRQADEFDTHECSSWHTSRRRQGHWSHCKEQASFYGVNNLNFIYLEQPPCLRELLLCHAPQQTWNVTLIDAAVQ